MKDKYGREIDYLRISLTENCNLRCVYCMPNWDSNDIMEDSSKILTTEEVIKISEIFSKFGVKKIRLTGGEPLLRKDLQEIISGINAISEINEICITTNALLLNDEKLIKLKEAGLNRINISLDSLDPQEYKNLTRGGDVSKVLNIIKKSLELGIIVKINSVITNMQNINSILDLIKLTLNDKIDIRFIELMPIGCGKELKGFTGNELLKIIESYYDGSSEERPLLKNMYILEGTSKYYKIDGWKGRIGFINPMSECFCSSCNRVRITSSGCLKNCLSSNDELNIKEILNLNISEEEKHKIIYKNIYNKNEKNVFNTENSLNKKMNQIGG